MPWSTEPWPRRRVVIGATLVAALVYAIVRPDKEVRLPSILQEARAQKPVQLPPTSITTTLPMRVAPWTPIAMDAKNLQHLESSIARSLACDESCRAKFHCSELEVLKCDPDCYCSNGFLLPMERKALPFARQGRFAIVLAGMTRSFFSKLMNEYFRLFLARFGGDLVIFAVLTTTSKQKLRRSGLPQKKDQVGATFVKRMRVLLLQHQVESILPSGT